MRQFQFESVTGCFSFIFTFFVTIYSKQNVTVKTTTWTQKEIDFLIKSYLGMGAAYVSKALNRTIEAVRTKAQIIGLISYSPQKWTE